MAATCSCCGKTILHLDRPDVLQRAQRIYDTLVELGGVVEMQKDLLGPLWERYRISHGTAQHTIDALAERGYLVVTYHGPGARRKRIRAVRRPEGPPKGPRQVIEDPGFPVRRVPAWYWRYRRGMGGA